MFSGQQGKLPNQIRHYGIYENVFSYKQQKPNSIRRNQKGFLFSHVIGRQQLTSAMVLDPSLGNSLSSAFPRAGSISRIKSELLCKRKTFLNCLASGVISPHNLLLCSYASSYLNLTCGCRVVEGYGHFLGLLIKGHAQS